MSHVSTSVQTLRESCVRVAKLHGGVASLPSEDRDLYRFQLVIAENGPEAYNFYFTSREVALGARAAIEKHISAREGALPKDWSARIADLSKPEMPLELRTATFGRLRGATGHRWFDLRLQPELCTAEPYNPSFAGGQKTTKAERFKILIQAFSDLSQALLDSGYQSTQSFKGVYGKFVLKDSTEGELDVIVRLVKDTQCLRVIIRNADHNIEAREQLQSMLASDIRLTMEHVALKKAVPRFDHLAFKISVKSEP